ncbi:MAG: hypothetical protein ABUL46_06425, partial [Chitinophaga rupis]
MPLRRSACIIFIIAITGFKQAAAQNTTPTVVTDQNAIPGAASGSASPYNGMAGYSLPVYTVKCGSLTLPVSLSYGYNGLRLDATVGWTGLGWNLQAGGVITRNVQGAVDNTKDAGRNYGEYSIKDSLQKPNNSAFFNNVYQDAHDTSFDTAPDI